MKPYQSELRVAIKAAQEATLIIKEIYQQSEVTFTMKSDNSPVTLADQLANDKIHEILHQEFPNYSILSEEEEDDMTRLTNDYVWIVDPLDGTKDFIAKTDEFSVNIALSYKGEIVLGVIAIPSKDLLYFATKNQGSFRIENNQTLENKVDTSSDHLIVLKSHFHQKTIEKEFLSTHQGLFTQEKSCGSAYKACLIASGVAHYMIKIGDGTKEWDIAASDIIISEAGGVFLDAYGKKIHYNRPDCYNHDGFVIMNRFNPKLLFHKL